MKLTDLNPYFIGHGGEGVSDAQGNPVPFRPAIGLVFDCPCGKCGSPIFVAFENPPDGGPRFDSHPNAPHWTRTGEDFAAMTLTPSILRKSHCGWHGFITNGEVRTV